MVWFDTQFNQLLEQLVALTGGATRDQKEKRKAEAEMRELVGKIFVGACALYALATTGVLAYKLGVLHELLPRSAMRKIDDGAAEIAAKTEPVLRVPKEAAFFLTRVYFHVGAAVVVNCLGCRLFEKAPYLPIFASAAGTVIPSALLLLFRKEHINPAARIGMYYGSALSLGYLMGPMHMITSGGMSRVAIASVASMTAFSVTAQITRGKLSYFCGTQLLASSLTVLGLVGTQMVAPQNIYRADALLTMQMMCNIAIAAVHTLPVFSYFARLAENEKLAGTMPKDPRATAAQKPVESPSSVLPSVSGWVKNCDELAQAKIIHSLGFYACWWTFKKTTIYVLRTISGRRNLFVDREVKRLGVNPEDADSVAKSLLDADRVSDVLGSLVFFLMYVKFISLLQRTNDVRGKLTLTGRIFRAANPFAWV